jgi:hypothetical protein
MRSDTFITRPVGIFNPMIAENVVPDRWRSRLGTPSKGSK